MTACHCLCSVNHPSVVGCCTGEASVVVRLTSALGDVPAAMCSSCATATAAPRYSWTQPCCNICWVTNNPGREPMTLQEAEREECVYCGEQTYSGIYVRIDPKTAPHPTTLK